MSTETHVFFRGKLPSKAALGRAMKELGFPLSIKPATGSLEQQSGFMPMTLRREETGVEFDVYSDPLAVEEFADAGVDPSFERRASFRWGGDFQEAVAGMCAAAALAKLIDGVVFDEPENRLLAVADAIDVARKNLARLPEPPPKQRTPRTQTTIKRLLAPLLEKRSDLALAGRLLLIRPVRHLVRGAVFRWHHQGTYCTVAPYFRPLYQPSELFLEDAIFGWSTKDPDFGPMLLDRLAPEVFEPMGQIATIEDFIASRWGKRLFANDLFPSLVLSRGIRYAKGHAGRLLPNSEKSLAEAKARRAATDPHDRMAMGFRALEIKDAEQGIATDKGRLAFLGRGSAAVLEYYRQWEAEVARGLKIEHLWESTPFPAELSKASRNSKSADPVFRPTPWPDYPLTWRQEPPQVPGEVKYGWDWWDRQGRVTLIHPISREQAEGHHRNFDGYTLMVRLQETQLLILDFSGTSLGRRVRLRVYGAQDRCMTAEFREDWDDPGILRMREIELITGGYWQSYLNFESGEKRIWVDDKCECRTMTDLDRSRYTFPFPSFDEFGSLWQRVLAYLSEEGFGAFA